LALITLGSLNTLWTNVSSWVKGTDTVSSPKVTVSAALPAGTNNIGDVDIMTIPALVAGTALIGKVGIDQTTAGVTNGIQINAALPAGTNNIGIVSAQSLVGTALNTAPAAITVTTTSADLTTGAYKELAIDINISAITGTTPSYTLGINRKGADGVYYPIYTGTAQTAVGKVSISLGIGASTNTAFGSTIQVVETVAGTTPSVTRSVSIIGK